MDETSIEILKRCARRYFPINTETKITIIPSETWKLINPIRDPLPSVWCPDAIPNKPSICTEDIDLTRLVRIDNNYYRFGFGSISNMLVIRKEKPNAYDKEEFDKALTFGLV
jgi:hypothetical protein